MKTQVEIVDGKPYIREIQALILEYTNSLHRDLTFQNLEEELEHLEYKYENPGGKLLAALSEKRFVVGCVAYHRLSDHCCEMKRLYVKPEYRGYQIGRKLVEKALYEAQKAGYKEMVLDTIEPLQTAISLYRKLGFTEIEAYYHNPMPDVMYMRKNLTEVY